MKVEALFIDGDLSATLRAQHARAVRAVDEVPESDFRSRAPSEVAQSLFDSYRVVPVELTEGAVSVEAHDTDVDRRKFSDLDHGFPGASPTLRGTRVVYHVPYTGEQTLLRLKSSTWTTVLPRAVLTAAELQFVYEVRSSEVAGTKRAFEGDLSLTKKWLGWVNDEASRFNEELANALEQGVNRRNARLAEASEGIAALGLPVRAAQSARILTQTPARSASTVHDAESSRYDVALSFAGEDRVYVEEVADHLKRSGVKAFYDKFESARLWGKDLVAHLQEIYQNRARFCVLFISEHYVNKPWPSHERRSAQARALVADEEYLLPARFDDTPLPGLPPTIGTLISAR